MIRSILFALALVAGVSSAAQAQNAKVVPTCGIQSLRVNDASALFMDATGTLCTVAGAGGSGGGGASGSVTPAGTSGTSAQAVQGITGGVPQNVAVTNPTVSGSQEQDVRGTATLSASTLGATTVVPVNGQGIVGFAFTGLTASGATLTYEQSIDGGTTWTGVNEVNAGTGVVSSTRSTDGQVRVGAGGRTNLRLRVSTAGTGTITIAWNVSVRESIVVVGTPLPPGSNAIGSVLADLRVGGAANAVGNPAFAQITNFPASQPVTNAGVFAVQNTAALPAGTNVIGRVGVDQTTPGTTNAVAATGTDGTTQRQIRTTTTGVLEPPTAAAGKITRTSTALTASTSTTIAAANTARIALGIQCASGGVSIDETGAALTAAAVGNGTLFIPAVTATYFTPPVATQTAVTAYTATAQTCVVTEYLR